MASSSSADEISYSIRQEIIRFESVHPSIYAIYDLIDSIDDKGLSDSLRQLVVSIEDAFVNSQEWTLSHCVPDIKLGLLGSVRSGKSALVHRYLTGTYLHEESPEGGRFKKEISLENQSHLLLIRDEGGPPDQQFSHWIDGVIFVFSLENFESYQIVYDYFARLSTYRNTSNLPVLLVGTQDSDGEPYVRVIDDVRARKLANDLKRCVYYETCAAYGLNVERVFQDACLKILQSRSAPSHTPPQNSASLQPAPATVRSNTLSSVLSTPSVSVHTGEHSSRSFSQPLPPASLVRCPDLLTNPGFEPDGLEDYHSSQTLSAAFAASLPGCMTVDTSQRLFQTLDVKSACEVDRLGVDLTASRGRRFCLTTDSAEDWATHPFKLDGQLQLVIHRSECVPSDYSESVVHNLTTHHTYSEYNARVPKLSASALLSDHTRLDEFAPTPDMAPLEHPECSPLQLPPSHLYSPSNPITTGSVSSIGLSGEVTETKGETNDSLTPSSTPTHSRKNRRKSNLFQKKNEDEKDRDKRLNGIGSGRVIPLKQGFLYKRTCKPLNKEWKTKKYVTLTDDARLTYHPSIHDYMDNTHGKEIDLSRTTVKIPGVPFRQVGGRITSNGLLRSNLIEISSDRSNAGGNRTGSPDLITAFADTTASGTTDPVASVKKRHRRVKSNPKGTNADGYDSEGYEFQLISMDRQWHFEAKGPEERDEWVAHIERAIMTRLQLNESNKRTRACASCVGTTCPVTSICGSAPNVAGARSLGDSSSLTSGISCTDVIETTAIEHLLPCIRAVAGNERCADCGSADPDWASLNLGALVCISCSGIHRQLGTHISRIRSLHLDEWSPESVAVMCAIGNTLANSVWEAAVPVNAGNRKKPDASSSREEKEVWIRAKYDRQEFLPPLPYPDAPLQQQLIDAIARQDTRQVVLCLALATPDTVNAAYSRQDPRAAIHIAATLGNLVYLQLLLWYNGDPAVTDHEGRNAYYYAHCSQKYDCAEFLRRNGCPKQLLPPSSSGLNSAVMERSAQPPSLSQQPVCSGGPYLSNPPNTGISSSTISRPYHFSHLQQQPAHVAAPVSCVLTGPPSQLFANQHHPFIASKLSHSATAVSQPYTQVASGNTSLQPHSAVPQFTSTVANSTALSGIAAVHTGGHDIRSGALGQQLPLASGSIGQAVGATLPRRRAPLPVAPSTVPPLITQIGQQVASSGSHRPHFGGIVDRTPVGLTRSSATGAPTAPPHITPSYGRSVANSVVPPSNTPGTSQQYAVNNLEVGL